MNNIIVYTKPTCSYCVKAKQLLTLKDKQYTEVVIGTDIMTENFLEMFPEVRAVPFVVIDGVKIGGYEELVEQFDNNPQFLAG